MNDSSLKYKLKFISDENLYKHVKETVTKYKFTLNLKEFNKNIIDPIKLTFDASVYGKTIEETIEAEVIRQMDKSNTNHIGYFHQNIFKYLGGGWSVPTEGFDVINEDQNVFVEMKNKHNTMNSSSAQKTYTKMQSKLLRNDKAVCLLVEVMAKKSQDVSWSISLDKEKISHKNIRRVSIDKFYERVTGEATAFKQLCDVLPSVIKDVISDLGIGTVQNTVFAELQEIAPDTLESLYLLAFSKYEGFGRIA